jgi:plasmid maintenance system antidote protein VapI
MSSIIFEKAMARISSKKINEIRLSVEIVERIYDLMEKYAMNQKELAQKLGKQPSEIDTWLSGMHNFTPKTISDLESIFGESILFVAQKQAELGGIVL